MYNVIVFLDLKSVLLNKNVKHLKKCFYIFIYINIIYIEDYNNFLTYYLLHEKHAKFELFTRGTNN